MAGNRKDGDARRFLLVVLAIVLIAALLLVGRCVTRKRAPAATPQEQSATPSSVEAPAPGIPATPPREGAGEVLTPATLTASARVTAGAEFEVACKGPGNAGDFVTIVPKDAGGGTHAAYAQVTPEVGSASGATLKLTAPMDASGSEKAKAGYELRYVAGRSRTVLGRAPIEVVAAGATLEAPGEAGVGSMIEVKWTGPNNAGDYITIAAKDWPDAKYGNYANTSGGSPLAVRALPDPGSAELRYVSGQDRRVLGRRPITLVGATATIAAPERAIAGSTIDVAWTGPNNAGDYITIVEVGTPDEKYGNYTNTSGGATLKLLLPIMDGKAEIRYVMDQSRKVLARREITITPAVITLSAAAECKAGEAVSITWTGPSHNGDYITIVAKATPDARYGKYSNTTAGSPLRVEAPKEAGDAEIRYVAGQGGKVLSRRAIRVVP